MTARPVPARIRKLVPVLDSTVEGEVVATARAIGRVLQAARQTYHDLAASIPVQGPGTALGDRRQDRREAPKPGPAEYDYGRWRSWRTEWARSHRLRSYTPLQEARQEDQAAFCRLHAHRLSDRERKFIFDISPRRTGLSLRQGDWLAAIADRLDHEHRDYWQ